MWRETRNDYPSFLPLLASSTPRPQYIIESMWCLCSSQLLYHVNFHSATTKLWKSTHSILLWAVSINKYLGRLHSIFCRMFLRMLFIVFSFIACVQISFYDCNLFSEDFFAFSQWRKEWREELKWKMKSLTQENSCFIVDDDKVWSGKFLFFSSSFMFVRKLFTRISN